MSVKGNTQRFLSEVAAAALEGRVEAAAKSAGPVTVPLPLHAREFLINLPQLLDVDAVACALKPLLQRAAVVSRSRRAAIVGGCLAFPVFAFLGMIFVMTIMQPWEQKNPGVMELNDLLHKRSAMRFMSKKNGGPTDPQVAIYIASHYRAVITNDATWSDGFTLALIRGEARRFAEQSVAEHPAPTETEIAEAEAALKGHVPKPEAFDLTKQRGFPLTVAGMWLAIGVCIPAMIAALLFRGGLVLLITGVTFVRRDGARASRLRVFWRGLVAWSVLLLALSLMAILEPWLGTFGATLACCLLICGLVLLSVALPNRGLPDRLAGTWPVPR